MRTYTAMYNTKRPMRLHCLESLDSILESLSENRDSTGYSDVQLVKQLFRQNALCRIERKSSLELRSAKAAIRALSFEWLENNYELKQLVCTRPCDWSVVATTLFLRGTAPF